MGKTLLSKMTKTGIEKHLLKHLGDSSNLVLKTLSPFFRSFLHDLELLYLKEFDVSNFFENNRSLIRQDHFLYAKTLGVIDLKIEFNGRRIEINRERM